MSHLLESRLSPQQRAEACAADAAEAAAEAAMCRLAARAAEPEPVIECAIATAAGSAAWAKKWLPDQPHLAEFAAAQGERRAGPQPIPAPASRPDQIIAAGDAKRRAYIDSRPTADAAMAYGAQIGWLHGQVRILCAEAEALDAVRDDAFEYVDVIVPSLSCELTVGFTYEPGSPPAPTSPQFFELTGDPGDDGEAEELIVFEVWMRGVEISLALSDEANDQIATAVLAKIAEMVAESHEP